MKPTGEKQYDEDGYEIEIVQIVYHARLQSILSKPPTKPDDTVIYTRNGKRAYDLEYLARKRIATPEWANRQEIASVYKEMRRLNRAVLKRKGERWSMYSVDHIIPLKGNRVCGLHVASNLRIVKISDNSIKNNGFRIEQDSVIYAPS